MGMMFVAFWMPALAIGVTIGMALPSYSYPSLKRDAIRYRDWVIWTTIWLSVQLASLILMLTLIDWLLGLIGESGTALLLLLGAPIIPGIILGYGVRFFHRACFSKSQDSSPH